MAHPSKPLLVTGGTGFIGTYVVQALLRQNVAVRIFAKGPPRWEAPSISGADLLLGDITDSAGLDEALHGASAVIHLAATVRAWSSDESAVYRVNVAGTENVIRGAIKAGVRRLVHVSSGSAVAFARGSERDERSIVPREGNLTIYGQSKAMAERVVEAAAREGLHTCIVYPTRVFGIGPLDDSNAATKVLRAYLCGHLPVLPSGGRDWANWAYVNDVASGIVQAAFRGGRSERYILGGENARLKDFFALSDSIAGRHHRTLSIPHWLGRTLASIEELRGSLIRQPPRITRAWYDAVFEDARASSAKAERELLYTITPLKEALKEVVPWLTAN
jgi:nucleoside-diphosphate-sugar epimerase